MFGIDNGSESVRGIESAESKDKSERIVQYLYGAAATPQSIMRAVLLRPQNIMWLFCECVERIVANIRNLNRR
jgi:hypothetical protein